MRSFTFILIIILLVSFKGQNKIKLSDFEVLKGSWTGTLTYLDYSSNKKTTIPCDVSVSQSASDKRVWYFKKDYPKEPHANTIDTVRLSRDGKMLNTRRLSEKTRSGSGEIKMIFQERYNDEGTIKDFWFTYSISKHTFSIKKEESLNGTMIERNQYHWQRK